MIREEIEELRREFKWGNGKNGEIEVGKGVYEELYNKVGKEDRWAGRRRRRVWG